jgi:mono/diheme cytochrome c family protein
MKKILKWIGIILLIIIVGVTIVTATQQHKTYSAPYPTIKASADMAVIARGKHLIFDIAHCADCHSTVNTDSLLKLSQDVPLSGGRLFPLPLGDIYSKNITPDKETGIGKYTDAEIARALRYGVHADGTAVFDFMPFHNITDEDMTAIISYLRAQKPVHNEVPHHNLNILGNVVNAFMVKPVGPSEEIRNSVQPDTTALYGSYIVNNLANCRGCHTRRDLSGKYIGEELAGGGPFKEKGKTTLTPPNLTPDPSSRIFGWSQKMFLDRFRMGKLIQHSHMPWNSFKRMTDDELKAIYNYLQTVKPAKTYVEK